MSKIAFAKNLIKKDRELPIYLIFGVTNVCNSRCLSCFAWKQTDSQREELSLDQIEMIASSMGRLLTLVLTGGEVFLRKDLVEIIDTFHKHTGVEFLTVPTNAIQYEKIAATIERILEVYPHNVAVNISLDGIGEVHDKIRGVPGNFDKVRKLYELLVPLKKRVPRMSVGVNTVLSSMNQNSYREIFRYVRENMPEIDQHNFEMMRGDFRSNEISPPDNEFLRRETPHIQELTSQYDYHSTGLFQRFLKSAKLHYHNVVLDHSTHARALPCYAGSLAGVIDHRGTVYPCELYKEIGNLKDYDYDFKALWFSQRGDAIRKEIRDTKCTCTHSCFQFVNILFNPWEYPRLLSPIRKQPHSDKK